MKTQGKVWIIYDAENKSQSKPLSVVQTQVVLLSIQPHNFGRYFLWTPGWDEWMSLKEFIAEDQKYFVLAHPPKPIDDVTVPNAAAKKANSENTQSGVHSSYTTNTSPFTEVEEPDTIVKDNANYGYYSHDFHGSDLDLSKIRKLKPEPTKKKRSPSPPSNADRRKDERHAFKIEVVLVSKVRSFRTHSRNISVSGTMLDKEIPNEFLKKPFDLIIVNPFEPDAAKSRLLFRAKIVGDLSDPRRLMFLEQDPEMTTRLEALLKAYVAYQTQIKKTAV
ncbi:hypothetical protein D3C87_1044720 [compost metagenome]